jgi:hypothetical protein
MPNSKPLETQNPQAIPSFVSLPAPRSTHTTSRRPPFWLGLAMFLRGWSLTARQAQEGLDLLTRGLLAVRATGAAVMTPLALLMIAEAQSRLGRPVEAHKALAEAAQVMEMGDERCNEAQFESAASRSVACRRRLGSGRAESPAGACLSCAPPPALPASGATRANEPKPAIYSRRSTTGSPKVSTPRSSRKPRLWRMSSRREAVSCSRGSCLAASSISPPSETSRPPRGQTHATAAAASCGRPRASVIGHRAQRSYAMRSSGSQPNFQPPAQLELRPFE